MGPIMPATGGLSASESSGSWLGLLLAVLVVLLAGAVVVGWVWARSSGVRRRPQPPEDLLRERYARGEIAWAEYRETVVNLLKDRYVQGEMDVREYEERVSRLLQEDSSQAERARARPVALEVESQTPRRVVIEVERPARSGCGEPEPVRYGCREPEPPARHRRRGC